MLQETMSLDELIGNDPRKNYQIPKNIILMGIVRKISQFHASSKALGFFSPLTIHVSKDNEVGIIRWEGEINKNYLSPELRFLKTKDELDKEWTMESDIYALGLIFYFMDVGSPMFWGQHDEYILKQQSENFQTILKGARMNEYHKEFFRRCCDFDPKKRIKITEATYYLKKLFVPDGYEVIGHGALSVVLKKSDKVYKFTTEARAEMEKLVMKAIYGKNSAKDGDLNVDIPDDIKYQGHCSVSVFRNLGNLTEFMSKKKEEIGLYEKLAIFLSTCKFVKRIHDQGYINRDIKPDSILLDGKLHATINGFDLSIREKRGLKDGGASTMLYMAPEAFTNDYSYGVDIYSLGCVLYFLLVGSHPYIEEKDLNEIIRKKKENIHHWPEECKIPEFLEETVYRCTESNVSRRISLEDLILVITHFKDTPVPFSGKD